MSELPVGWQSTSLGEIGLVQSGVGFPNEAQGLTSGDYPVYKVGDVSRGVLQANGQLLVAANYVSKEKAASMRGHVFAVGSTLFAKIGEALKLNRRAFVLREGLADNNVMGYKAVPGVSDKFVHYFLRTQDLSAYSRSTTVPSIRKGDVEEVVIPLPPSAEQTRIAAKLDELLAQVDTLKVRIDGIPAVLKRFRQSVLSAAVSGRLTEEWREKNALQLATGSQLLLQTAECKRVWAQENEGHNESGRVKKRLSAFAGESFGQNDLPDSWCWAKLEDVSLLVVDCHNKTAPYEENGIPLVRTSNIRDGQFLWDDLRYVSEDTYSFWSRRCMPEPGDIVFTREAPMGEAAIIPEGRKICLGQRTMLIRCIKECTSAEFILLALLDPKFKERSEKLAVGTGVKHYRVGDVSDLPIPVPPKAEQTEIVRRVEQLFAFADQLEAKVKEAKTRIDRLTQSILAKAFRGELVPQDPNDEPASELLARIQAQRAAAPKAKRGRNKVV